MTLKISIIANVINVVGNAVGIFALHAGVAGIAWAWGNDGTFGGNMTAETLRPIFDTAMENGLNLWDTAYAYGMGTSEKEMK